MFESVTKFPNLRVIAVEDYLMNQELLEAILVDFGCDFEIVDSNSRAFAMHKKNPFDIMLIDMNSSDIAPVELDKVKDEIPVIALRNLFSQNKSEDNTIVDNLSRPVRIKELERVFLRRVPQKAMRS